MIFIHAEPKSMREMKENTYKTIENYLLRHVAQAGSFFLQLTGKKYSCLL